MMQPQSFEIHAWRAGYRAYIAGTPFTDAPKGDDRGAWLNGYTRARTDRARRNRAAAEERNGGEEQ